MRPLVGRALTAGLAASVLTRAGLVRPYAPWTLASLGTALLRWGTGPAGGFIAAAVRTPHRVAVVDERGATTYAALDARTNALARGLAGSGVAAGDSVAVMCRNHVGFIEATIALAKLGADILYLNTAFAGPALREVLEREQPALVIHDDEFAQLLGPAAGAERARAWVDDAADRAGTLDALAADQDESALHPSAHRSRLVILTSGTTGTPRGAARSEAGLDAAVGVLERIPLRDGWRTHVAAPLFHTWGLAHLGLALLLGSTVVLRRSFDPEECLRTLASERCEAFAVIPVMLQRILALPEESLAGRDLSALQVVASSGSALPGDLAIVWMDRFGDHLYNLYGSTEVAYAGIATPADLRDAPTTAGRPPRGTDVSILDEAGHPVPAGHSGRIFVGNSLLVDGYTDGGGKEVVRGLMSTGDVGRVDAHGRLFVEGRDDDMIVSGGENVFPSEVEDCLARCPGVLEVAVVGAPDPEFGQALTAYVVASDHQLGEEELRAWVRDRLARFKVPRRVVLVPELPRNATGKILKGDLRP